MTDPAPRSTEAPVGAAAFSVDRRAPGDRLAAVLEPLGLQRVQSLALASFEGTVRGRKVRLGCSMRSRHRYVGVGNASVRTFQGWMIETSVETDIRTRLLCATRRPAWWARKLLARRGLRPVEGLGGDPGGEVAGASGGGLVAYATEPPWAIGFLGASGSGPVGRLLAEDGADGRTLQIGPYSLDLLLSVPTIQEVAGSLPAWIDACIDLVELGESRRPERRVDPTRFEQLSHEDPRKAALVVTFGFLFGVPLAMLVLGSLGALALLAIGGPRLVMFGLIAFAAILMPVSMGILLWQMARRSRSRAS